MRNFKSCIKGLHGFAGVARGWMLLCVLIGLIGVTASLSFVAVCKTLVDIATGTLDKPIMPYVWAMIDIMLLQLLSHVAYDYLEGLNSIKTQIRIRRSLYAHVLNSQWDGRDTFHSGDAINRLEQDVSIVVEFCCSRLPSVVITVFQLLAASVFLLMMAPNLLWILLVLMVVAVFGSRLFFNTLRSLTNAIRAKESAIQAHLQETLQNPYRRAYHCRCETYGGAFGLVAGGFVWRHMKTLELWSHCVHVHESGFCIGLCRGFSVGCVRHS